MKKKIFGLFLCLSMTLALTACGGQSDKNDSEKTDTQESAEDTESAEGRVLVVYYSATGNTKEAAGYIAAATGADTFELVPAEPYTDEDLDYNDDSSRVVHEHENPDARVVELVESTVPDWESYDTVFIGYAGGIIGLN